MKLVLFDIDGTLLRTDGAGRRAMEGALLAVFNASGDEHYRYDGKTDRQIIREQMRHAGVDDATITARIADVLELYVQRLDAELVRGAARSQLCGGVMPLLDAVEADGGIVMGLLTGNIEHGARRKLGSVGIEFSRFRVNAFGSDHEERPQLPAVAQRRAAELLGRTIPGEQIVIIGDTPADIHCGRALGVRAIGVATGRYSVQDLTMHGPAAVFESFDDTDAVLGAIRGQ